MSGSSHIHPKFREPMAKGSRKTKPLHSLSEAIALILEDRRDDGLRGLPSDAILDKVTVK